MMILFLCVQTIIISVTQRLSHLKAVLIGVQCLSVLTAIVSKVVACLVPTCRYEGTFLSKMESFDGLLLTN